jgi:hypothetical protein
MLQQSVFMIRPRVSGVDSIYIFFKHSDPTLETTRTTRERQRSTFCFVLYICAVCDDIVGLLSPYLSMERSDGQLQNR